MNYFNRFGRTWQVYIEAEGDYRTDAKNVGQFFVRNANGEPVPLDAISTIEDISGPEFTMRYNEYRSAQINGTAAPGYSSNQAMNALEEVFRQTMPNEMGYDYLGMSYQEKKAQQGVSPTVVFGMSLLFVFLILAALYESWSLPFSVLLGTPVAVFGAFADALAARNAKQHLRANRSGHAHRSGGEERDPDRRIRQGRIRKRQTAARCRARRRALALAADPDDFVRLHLRMFAALVCQRLRRGRASRSWLDRHRRNDRRLGHRDLSDPGNLLRDRAALRRSKSRT